MLRQHLTKTTGNNGTGITPVVYIAPIPWFLTIAVPPAVETTPGLDVIITASHLFTDPDYGFVKIELTDNTGMIKWNQVGELDSESINGKVEGFASGLSAAMFSFMSKPFDGIVLLQEKDCDTTRYYQIGTACTPARKKGWEASTGVAGGEGRKGVSLSFEANMNKPLIYVGALTLATQDAVS